MTDTTDIEHSSPENKQQIKDLVDQEFGLTEGKYRQNGEWTCAHFGVYGDGGHGDTEVVNLKTAVDASADEGKKLVMTGKVGNTFRLDAMLDITGEMLGQGVSVGRNPTRFIAGNNDITLINLHKTVTPTFWAQTLLENIQLHGNGYTGCTGLRVSDSSICYFLRNISATRITNGIVLNGAQFCRLEGITVADDTGAGGTTVALLITPELSNAAGGGNNITVDSFFTQSYDIGIATLDYRASTQKWVSGAVHALNDVIVPTSESSIVGHYLQCTSISGQRKSGTTEPVWTTATTNADGDLVWTAFFYSRPIHERNFNNIALLTSRLCGYVTQNTDPHDFFSLLHIEECCEGVAASKQLMNITVNKNPIQIYGANPIIDRYTHSQGDSSPPILIRSTVSHGGSLVTFRSPITASFRVDIDDSSNIQLTENPVLYSGNNVGVIARNILDAGHLTPIGPKVCLLTKQAQTVDRGIPNSCYMTTGGANSIAPYYSVGGITSPPTVTVEYDSLLGVVRQAAFQNVVGNLSTNALYVYSRATSYSGTVNVDSMCAGLMVKSDIATTLALSAWQTAIEGTLQMAAGVWYYLFLYSKMLASPRGQNLTFYPISTDAPKLSFARIQSADSMGTAGYDNGLIARIAKGHWNPNQPDLVWRTNAAPTTGTWPQNHVIKYEAPLAGGYEGMVCTTPGGPGTFVFKNFGAIAP